MLPVTKLSSLDNFRLYALPPLIAGRCVTHFAGRLKIRRAIHGKRIVNGMYAPTGLHAHVLAYAQHTLGGPAPASANEVIFQICDFIIHAFDKGRGVNHAEFMQVLGQKNLTFPEEHIEGVFAAIFGHKQEYKPMSDLNAWRSTYSLVGEVWKDTPHFRSAQLIKAFKSEDVKGPIKIYRRP